MTRWTREQEAAIRLRGADILVSAAAGSGKTAVLVERIIQIVIYERVPIMDLLVLTYTNAAAGEMRERIENALAQAMETEKEPETKAFLLEQLRVLNRASIKTFHAFCMEIIRSHFQRIGVDPSFRMLNETERNIMIEEAIDAVFEASYEEETETFIFLVEAYSGNREDTKLRDMIKSIYRFVLSQPYPMKWLEEQIKAYEDESHPKRHMWRDLFLSQMTQKIEGAFEVLEEAMEICKLPCGPLPYLETLESDYAKFKTLEYVLSTGEIEQFQKAIELFSFDRIKSIKKAEKELMDESLIELVKNDLRDKLVKQSIFEALSSPFKLKSYQRYIEELAIQSLSIGELQRLVSLFETEFKALKQAQNVLDFNDLEHFAIKILEDDEISKAYRNHYTYIFVDEYQDASTIQETLLNRIKSVNNVFMVGDVKQSIYKFRLAEPSLFQGKYKSYEKYDDVLKQHEAEHVDVLNKLLVGERQIRIDLKKNFRTRTDILESVNCLFEDIMSERLGEVTYDEAAHLVGGSNFEEAILPSIQVQVISKKPVDAELVEQWQSSIVDEQEENDEVLMSLEAMKTDEVEARSIAGKIKEIIGTPVYFPKEKVWRPCQYKDIVILIRSFRSWQQTFDSVLSEEGIPFYAESSSGYFDTLEIRLMMDFLRVLDNPYQDLSLLSVMRSPMFGFTVEELIEIRRRDNNHRYFLDKVKQVMGDEETEEDLRIKLKGFTGEMDSLRALSRYSAIDEVILEILKRTKFDRYVSVMPGGVSRLANLNLLVERATQFKHSKVVNLTLFVQFYDQLTKTSGDMGVASSIAEADDVVRLMSIHKSKGLEFPVVMVAGLGRKFNLMDTYGDLMMHKEIGIGLSFVDIALRSKSNSFIQWIMKEKMKIETLSEELRVLYVALTRPVDRLYLFGTVTDAGRRSSKWKRGCSYYNLITAGNFMDWIMSSGKMDTQIVEPSVLLGKEMSQADAARERVDAWHRYYEEAKQEPELLQETEIFKQFSKVVDTQEHSYEPQKISVSDMKKHKQEFRPPSLVQVPLFLQGEVPLSAAEKGTAMHTVLEHLDFSKIYDKQAVQVLINSLSGRRLLTEQEAKHIEPEKIMQFLVSDLGIKLRTAKHFKETPFVLKQGKQLIQGIIDLYLETEEGLILVDYKTDFIAEDELQNVANRYKIQLDAYEQALTRISEKKVIAKIIVFLNHNLFYQF